jgi:hypothetical protein
MGVELKLNVQKLPMIIGLAVLASTIVTLLTSLINATPPFLLGATWHGWPFAWLYVIVYPGSPWSINWMNFGADLTLWFALSFMLLASLLALAKTTRRMQVVR